MLDVAVVENLIRNECVLEERPFYQLLEKAKMAKGLTIEEAYLLLSISDGAMMEALRSAALEVKRTVFGNRIVLFAPLYLSNECGNTCRYCGFSASNDKEARRTLSVEEAVNEARALCERGFKRVLLVSAENSVRCGVDYICEVVKAIYDKSEMEIIHLNAAPMEMGDLCRLNAAGVGVFQVFQETYHKATYSDLHPKGKKRDYDYRLTCMERAMEAGFRDVGIGALLGLYDYKFDVIATIAHAHYLRTACGSWPHTISVPRFRHAVGAEISGAPFPVDDDVFKKIVAVYRLAVPTAGVVVSTREPSALRDEILFFGASQISAESSTSPGGYANTDETASQFDTSDRRTLEEVVGAVLDAGMMPSFCTACYRSGREGAVFHDMASNGAMKKFCDDNAIASLNSYLSAPGRDRAGLRNKLGSLR